MSQVISIEDMKQRILKPRGRAALNANPQAQTSASPQATADRSRGTSHGALESGAVADQTGPAVRFPAAATVPPSQGFYGGVTPLRIPKPSELFGIHTGRVRQPPTLAAAAPPAPAAAIAPLQPAAARAGVPSLLRLPAPGVLSAPSVTRRKEHDRRLRAISTKLQRANQKRRLDASVVGGGGTLPGPAGPREPSHPPVGFLDLSLGGYSNDDAPTPGFLGLLSGLRRWLTSSPPTTHNHPAGPHPFPDLEQDVGVHLEFDTDVVDALVYTVGRWMGLDTEQLRDSPGLRTLVSRNIQWFRNSPDWMKLLGLVMAKKLNHTLDCPKRSASDTQRMLLDRMIMQEQQQRSEQSGTTGTVVIEPPTTASPMDGDGCDVTVTGTERVVVEGQSEVVPPPMPAVDEDGVTTKSKSKSKKPTKPKNTKPKKTTAKRARVDGSLPPAKRTRSKAPLPKAPKLQPRQPTKKPRAMDLDAPVPPPGDVPNPKKRGRSNNSKKTTPPNPASVDAESAVVADVADPLLCPPPLTVSLFPLTPLDPSLITDDASRCDSSGDTPMLPPTDAV